jgi:hypothetical protein
MNLRVNALEDVRLQAETYFEDVARTQESRRRLIKSIKKAREANATQQAITDACYVDDKRKLSRQRIAQLEKEKSDG